MTKTTTPETVTKLTQDEMVDSLTGFEEIAIEKHFDAEIFDLSVVKRMRAMVMIMLIREGKSGPEAKKEAMGFTQAQIVGYFADDEGEDDPESDFPVTVAGKDDAEPA